MIESASEQALQLLYRNIHQRVNAWSNAHTVTDRRSGAVINMNEACCSHRRDVSRLWRVL